MVGYIRLYQWITAIVLWFAFFGEVSAQLPVAPSPLHTSLSPQQVHLTSKDQKALFTLSVKNTSREVHSGVTFSPVFDPKLLSVSGCEKKEFGILKPGEGVDIQCTVQMSAEAPTYIGKAMFQMGVISSVGTGSSGGGSMATVYFPKTDQNAVAFTARGCADKKVYDQLKTQTTLDDEYVPEKTVRSRWTPNLIFGFATSIFGLVFLYICAYRIKFQSYFTGISARIVSYTSITLSVLIGIAGFGLIATEGIKNTCDWFPKRCALLVAENVQEAKDLENYNKKLGTGVGTRTKTDRGFILLTDARGRFSIEYPPSWNQRYLNDAGSIVITGPSADADPTSGLLSVRVEIDAFDKTNVLDMESMLRRIRSQFEIPGITIIGEEEGSLHVIPAHVIHAIDSRVYSGTDLNRPPGSPSKTATDIYVIHTKNVFYAVHVYARDNCGEVFAEELKHMLESFKLFDAEFIQKS